MEKIQSFQKNHDVIRPGFSLSGIQQGVSTFDARFKVPNSGDYLSYAAMHTIEHLLATTLRNGPEKENIIYFGPMGCRTGFYLLTVNLGEAQARRAFTESIRRALALEEIPGAKRAECGNYREHDLDEAKRELTSYLALFDQEQIP